MDGRDDLMRIDCFLDCRNVAQRHDAVERGSALNPRDKLMAPTPAVSIEHRDIDIRDVKRRRITEKDACRGVAGTAGVS